MKLVTWGCLLHHATPFQDYPLTLFPFKTEWNLFIHHAMEWKERHGTLELDVKSYCWRFILIFKGYFKVTISDWPCILAVKHTKSFIRTSHNAELYKGQNWWPWFWFKVTDAVSLVDGWLIMTFPQGYCKRISWSREVDRHQCMFRC